MPGQWEAVNGEANVPVPPVAERNLVSLRRQQFLQFRIACREAPKHGAILRVNV